MPTITYPLLTVVDDSGAVVAGATVAITSVTDKSGTPIASHGATLNSSGANVSVDYDAETKGEGWIVLAVSKVGSTFTGLNAAPAFFLARDSGLILTNLNAAVGSRATPADVLSQVVDALQDYGVATEGGQVTAEEIRDAILGAAAEFRDVSALEEGDVTIGDCLAAGFCLAAAGLLAGDEAGGATGLDLILRRPDGTAFRRFSLTAAVQTQVRGNP